jgi:dynein heavy chain 2
MRKIFDKVEVSNKLLRSVVGAGVNLTSLQSKWESLEIALEYHEVMVKEQLESMKTGVDSRIIAFNADLAKFSTRWNDIKPNKVAVQDKEAAKGTLMLMRDVRQEFQDLKRVADEITFDCKTFDMPAPNFPGLDTLDEDISKVSCWCLRNCIGDECPHCSR